VAIGYLTRLCHASHVSAVRRRSIDRCVWSRPGYRGTGTILVEWSDSWGRNWNWGWSDGLDELRMLYFISIYQFRRGRLRERLSVVGAHTSIPPKARQRWRFIAFAANYFYGAGGVAKADRIALPVLNRLHNTDLTRVAPPQEDMRSMTEMICCSSGFRLSA
jgi:hypothetical protein